MGVNVKPMAVTVGLGGHLGPRTQVKKNLCFWAMGLIDVSKATRLQIWFAASC